MRIQTRLFLGTALLVLALMGTQWWLHARQIQAVEEELGTVATSVGAGLLSGHMSFVTSAEVGQAAGYNVMWFGAETDAVCTDDADGQVDGDESSGDQDPLAPKVSVVMVAGGDAAVRPQMLRRVVTKRLTADVDQPQGDNVEAHDEIEINRIDVNEVIEDGSVGLRRVELRVVSSDESRERFLIVSDDSDPGEMARIPIPVADTVEVFESMQRQGFAVGIGLLGVGLVASGVLARRVARPLRHLTDGAEALGRGELGFQVPVRASGEVGELQRAFNEMSDRLAELELERESWRRREHLAQLGDLARGLAHTLRNPLNTLGLAVEELATRSGGQDELVAAARAQIRRIDRWLRSFLALGAGDAAASESCDLGSLVQEVVFEAVQQGAVVTLSGDKPAVMVRVVPGALRAALANLLENAVEASPAAGEVAVTVAGQEGRAVVHIRDRGSGLPDEVRERLFSPHVTTKAEGAGMGLFLARQLVVGMHGGTLSLEDGDGGGTQATVSLPVADGGWESEDAG